jgi:replicative DNA helicase
MAGPLRSGRSQGAPSSDPLQPPHSVEAEQAVLGGLLIDPAAWDQVGDMITADDFYRPDHRLVFGALAELVAAGKPGDVVTVSEQLAHNSNLDNAGGLAYLGTLARDTPTAANVRAYAQIVRERSLLRKLITAGREIASSAFGGEGLSARDLVDQAEKRVFEIAEQSTGRREGAQRVSTLLPGLIDQIDEWHSNPDKLRGLPTGFTDFDRLTGGLRGGDLVIVAGRPSMGKTTLAVNMAEYAAVSPDSKAAVAIFSMEMPSDQLVTRMLSSIGHVPLNSIRSGQISDEDWVRITAATSQLSEARIFIDESAALTPTELRARARRLKREHGLDLVIVDYMQLMQVPGTQENRATEIAEISRGLKALAKELNIPVIALSQLNRSVEARTEKKPVMSDLRECVTGETRVCLTNGQRVPIRELVGKMPRVWAMDSHQKLVAADAECVWSVGKRGVLRISLASGRMMRATARHRLYSGNGWERVDALRVGDRLGVCPRLPAAEMSAPHPGRSAWGNFMAARGDLRKAFAQIPARTSIVMSRALSLMPRMRVTLGNEVALVPGDTSDWPFSTAPRVSTPRDVSVSDVSWDRIVAIEPDGSEEVFDLTVPGPASWLADGVVSHNSGAIEQDADMILLIYREEVYDKNTTKRGIAQIDLAKHRNGETGMFMLTFQGAYSRFTNYAADSYAEGVLK